MRVQRWRMVASLLWVVACGGDSSGPPKVASVGVTALTNQIEVGATLQLTASALDGKGNPLPGRVITWTSSAASVASVDNAGIVTGVTPGSATITATSEGVSGTVGLTVVPVPVSAVFIDPRSPSVRQGGTAQLTAVAQDAIGRVLTGRTITWSSAQPAVATVSEAGLVTGLAAGTTFIRASSEGKTDSVPLRVRGLNAPTITATAPATWTPGAAVTITGTNFGADVASNEVFVNGARATVTAASATSLSVIVPSITSLPCTPNGPVPLIVSVNGDSVASQATLALSTPRSLAIGEAMLLTAQADLLCNEFPVTGGTYVVTAFNYGTSATQAASFQLLGAARTAPAALTLAPAQPLAYAAPAVPAAGPLAVVAARTREERLAIGHAEALRQNIAFLNAHPGLRRAMAARRARERAAAAQGAPGAARCRPRRTSRRWGTCSPSA